MTEAVAFSMAVAFVSRLGGRVADRTKLSARTFAEWADAGWAPPSPLSTREAQVVPGRGPYTNTGERFVSMHHLMTQLWKDDRGVMEAIEFLLTASILAFGLVVGLTALRNAITAEFEELANAVLAINFGFSAGGLSGCCASVSGSQAIQTPQTITGHVCTPPIPTIINVAACP